MLVREYCKVYKRIYKTEKTHIDVDDESILYSKEYTEYMLIAHNVKRTRADGYNPTINTFTATIRCMPDEELGLSVGDKLVYKDVVYYIDNVDATDYRSVYIEARA